MDSERYLKLPSAGHTLLTAGSLGSAGSARHLDILFSAEDKPELVWRLHVCLSAQDWHTDWCIKQQTFAAYSSGGFSG